MNILANTFLKSPDRKLEVSTYIHIKWCLNEHLLTNQQNILSFLNLHIIVISGLFSYECFILRHAYALILKPIKAYLH